MDEKSARQHQDNTETATPAPSIGKVVQRAVQSEVTHEIHTGKGRTMARIAVPQDLFDVIVTNGPAASWLPRSLNAAMAKMVFKVVDDRATREKFGYAPR